MFHNINIAMVDNFDLMQLLIEVTTISIYHNFWSVFYNNLLYNMWKLSLSLAKSAR
eukprot:UN01426